MIHKHVIIYTGSIIDPDSYSSRIDSLMEDAQSKGWTVEKVISETVFDPDDTSEDRENYQTHDPIFEYLYNNVIKDALLMVTDVKCLGKKVSDILDFVDQLHEWGIALYIKEFNMTSLENGKENTTFKLLLHIMANAAEIEANSRKTMQMEGVERARSQGKYQGRKRGAKANIEKFKAKYDNVIRLIEGSNLSLRQIAARTKHSVNTIRRIKKILKDL
jgi:DNA invertase Pin-like site-specific DNA recombinase